MAKLVAGWSKDPSTGVGAVIVDDRYRVLSLGFNGLPHGIQDSEELLQNREMKLKAIIHAEENALLFATRSVYDATCYVWPLQPCARCASKLIQAGISRVVAPAERPEHWAAENELAMLMLSEAGVKVDLVGSKELVELLGGSDCVRRVHHAADNPALPPAGIPHDAAQGS